MLRIRRLKFAEQIRCSLQSPALATNTLEKIQSLPLKKENDTLLKGDTGDTGLDAYDMMNRGIECYEEPS